MSKDVKIELIYFKNNTDVSLEFGLHGNYPMRLLSSNCNDLSSFFHSLKRAVQRSEIIIVLGGYEGNEYLPQFIASSIGKGTYTPEYSSLGISAVKDYKLPEGAVPLSSVSKNFGGFLIESGPQTIISLTEDKQVRLNITKNLLVKYIHEHYYVFNSGRFVAPAKAVNEQTEETVELTNATVEPSVESAETINETQEPIIDNTDTKSIEENQQTKIDSTEYTDISSYVSIDEESIPLMSVINDVNEEAPTQDEIAEITAKYTQPTEKKAPLDIDPNEIIFDNKTKNKQISQHKVSRIICIILIIAILLGSLAAVIFIKPANEQVYNQSSISSVFSSNSSNESGINSSTNNSSDLSSDQSSQEEEYDDTYTGEADLVLPLPDTSIPGFPTTSSEEATSSVHSSTSSIVSSTTSSVVSSTTHSTTSSTPSTSTSTSSESISSNETSSSNTSTQVSSVISSANSSVTSSSTVSSTPASSNTATSSTTSSTTSSATPSTNPYFTWNTTATIVSSNDGKTYSGTAAEIVAMMCEAEVSSSAPKEAIKAQAVAAYCWLYNNGVLTGNVKKVPAKVAKANCTNAVNEVKGYICLYDGRIAATNYYAYSAGKTACSQHIWEGDSYIPYLQSVDCSVDEQLSDFMNTTTYTADEVKAFIKNGLGIDVSGIEDKTQWIVPVYDQNNLYCNYVYIGGVKKKGQALRNNVFGLWSRTSNPRGLKSPAYTIDYNAEKDEFTVVCRGWGHGVGMSQRGAKAYATLGWDFEKILEHFFTGVEVVQYK